MFEKIFHLKENHTDVKTEIMAGITTFMTMAYILAVNPSILSASGMDANAVLIATSLASFIGTEYEDVLIEYLGSYAVLGASGTCPYHTSASSSGSNTMVENTLIPDAKILLSQAYAQLQSMDVLIDAQRYSAIQSAITNLEYVISLPAPTTAEVASAMGQLTQAMAGIY